MDDPKTIKQTVPFAAPLYHALMSEASAQRREFTEHVQRVLYEHAFGAGYLNDEDKARVKLMWELVDEVVEVAKQLCRDGKFTRAITNDAIEVCVQNPKWASKYKDYVKDDIFKSGNPLKGTINREIGYRVRQGIGGTVETTPDGKATNAKVTGSIIQSYTPMVKFDPEAVAI